MVVTIIIQDLITTNHVYAIRQFITKNKSQDTIINQDIYEDGLR